jgi:predicted enzyme involved in methoxymalonyl-ACP biosynthesis
MRRGISVLRAEYLATNKNIQVEKFYDNLGFSLIDSNEKSKSYAINLHEYKPRALSYIEVI